MNEEQVKQIAQQVFTQNTASREFTVSNTSFHKHNGTDSPRVSQGDIINGTTSAIHLKSTASEIFTINTVQNITQITLTGVASNSLGQKAILNGHAQLGNCFRYGTSGVQASTIGVQGGTYQPFFQTNDSLYIDTTDLTKTGATADGANLINVAPYQSSPVAIMQITKWTGTSIVFETALATPWWVEFFLTMS